MKNLSLNINNFIISSNGIFWPGDDKHLPYKVAMSRIWDVATKDELYRQPFSQVYAKTLPVVLQAARMLALRLMCPHEPNDYAERTSSRTALTDIE